MMDEVIDVGANLQDLGSHRTGLPAHEYFGGPFDGGVGEMISKLRYLKPSAELRQQFQYNNLMYEALSHLTVLHSTKNQTYEEYVGEKFFQPLNMTSTTYSVKEAEGSGLLANSFVQHGRDLAFGIQGTVREVVPYMLRPGQENIWAGAAGIFSTARDMVKWLSMLMNSGIDPISNSTIVTSDIITHAANGVSVSAGTGDFPELSPQVYGCAQWGFSYRGHETVEHTGHNPGYHSQVARYPNDNIGVIVLTNNENAYFVAEAIKYRLTDELLGLDFVDWEPRDLTIQNTFADAYQAITIPENPSDPSTPFADMEGTYSHPAYGTFNACYIDTSPSEGCATAVNHPVIQQVLGNSTTPALVMPYPRYWAKYILFQHFDGNLFNASMIWTNWDMRREEGLETNMDEVTEGDVITGQDARFVAEWIDGQWALRGDFWGASGDVVIQVGEGQGEVVFDRV
ncbi:beta-lactamase/transpeptidase-like protein [Hymenopellis radicata]|nr:beta-lactamase/transpeptidase-like protein [Hymenopellis radicata]